MLQNSLQTLKFATAWLRFVMNPKSTPMIFVMADAGIEKIRRYPEEYRKSSAIYQQLDGFNKAYADRYFPQICLQELQSLPAGTFGYAVYEHFKCHGLSTDFYKSITVNDEFTYASELQSQTHDLWHVILGKDISLEDELFIQAYTVGQTANVLSVALVAGIILHCLAKFPFDVWKLFDAVTDGYSLGKNSKPLLPIRWEEWYALPIEEIRSFAGVS